MYACVTYGGDTIDLLFSPIYKYDAAVTPTATWRWIILLPNKTEITPIVYLFKSTEPLIYNM
jgi:hypothetical protein